jgi:sarcosine oxidase
MGVGLRVTRQVLVWVWPRTPDEFVAGRFPVWAMQTPHGFAYGFPLAPGRVGLKLALHELGEEAEPGSVCRDLRPADREPLERVLAEFIPGAAGAVLAHAVCLYTNSSDGQFIIDRHPGSERVVFAAGFSGHGFKFAPVVGEALADLALDGRTALPVAFLGLDRFVGGADA